MSEEARKRKPEPDADDAELADIEVESTSDAAFFHDHLGQTWEGDPESNHGLKTDVTGGGATGLTGKSRANWGTGVHGEGYTGVSGDANWTDSEFGTGVEGHTSGEFGEGVLGLASSIDGKSYGVEGATISEEGAGVKGVNFYDGENYGVEGTTYSSNYKGAGVRGYAAANDGSGTGVEGVSRAEDGQGVFAEGTANSGFSDGVVGKSNSSRGYGVWALNYGGGLAFVSQGDMAVTGGIYATSDVGIGGDLDVRGTKNFVQSVETTNGPKEVVYTAVEASKATTEVTDVAEMKDGRAEIDLPDHFGMVTSTEEVLNVQVTPYGSEPAHPQVTERSVEKIVVEDLGDGPGSYQFSYMIKGIRKGHEDKEIVREPRKDIEAERTAREEKLSMHATDREKPERPEILERPEIPEQLKKGLETSER